MRRLARPAELFGVDLRSLALLRVGLGALLLVDLAQRARHFRAFYTDDGVLPRAELGLYGPLSLQTLHAWVGASPIAVAALFAAAAAFAAALALGYRTRVATVASWVLLASLQWRNPPIHHGGDVMLRMLLFWGMFLPLGARASLDRRRGTAGPEGPLYASVATAALLLQICFVYAFAVAQRTGRLWWEGEALWYALHYDLVATRFALWLREQRALLPPLSLAAIWLELLGPALAFAPLWTGPLRTLAVAAFLLLHAGLAATLSLGLFPAVFCVAWLAFLPGWFWDRLLPRLGVARHRAARPAAPGGPRGTSGALAQATAAVLLLYVFLCNLKALEPSFLERLPEGWDAPARLLRIDQRWGLLAPDPPVYDGWYVVTGHLENEREVNLLEPERPAGFDKPELVSATLDIRWREFFFDLQLDRRDPRWRSYGRYRCREWNRAHAGGDRLDRLRVYFVRETTLPTGPEPGEILVLLGYDCPRPGAAGPGRAQRPSPARARSDAAFWTSGSRARALRIAATPSSRRPSPTSATPRPAQASADKA